MNTGEILNQIFAINKEMNELRGTIHILEGQRGDLIDELSVYWGEKYSGFKVGDVVEYTEKTWKRTRTARIKITGFDVYLPYDDNNNYEDKHPVIIGTVVLKNGAVGVQEKRIYHHENISLKKVQS